MKRIITAAIALLTCFAVKADPLDKLWDEGNTAYVNADYQRAIECYDSILASGQASYKLYYNLGNAHFKQGKNGGAILNYNRALRLSPSNADVKYNLAIANSHVKDKIDRVPEFFLITWVRTLRTSLGSNMWAGISLAALALALAAVLMYLLSNKMPMRKTGFYFAAGLSALFIVSVSFSSIEKRRLTAPSHAIVMRSSVSVKSSPDSNSKDIFILHEGTMVEITDSLGEWSEIVIADGNKGWITRPAIEKI